MDQLAAAWRLVLIEGFWHTGAGLHAQEVVHPENVAAQSLYQQIGFAATGEERWGEPVYRLGFA